MHTSITLPWFAPELNPNNSRTVHHHKKAAVIKKARMDAGIVASQYPAPTWEGKIWIKGIFYPPDKRHRDITNCEAACKAYLDGIADAWKINDIRFRIIGDFGEVVRGGLIEMQFYDKLQLILG